MSACRIVSAAFLGAATLKQIPNDSLKPASVVSRGMSRGYRCHCLSELVISHIQSGPVGRAKTVDTPAIILRVTGQGIT